MVGCDFRGICVIGFVWDERSRVVCEERYNDFIAYRTAARTAAWMLMMTCSVQMLLFCYDSFDTSCRMFRMYQFVELICFCCKDGRWK